MPLTFCTFERKAFCQMLCDCLPPLVNYSRERSRKSASSVHPHVKMINKIMVLDLRILTVYWLWSNYTAYKLYFCQIKWICYIFYKENLSCVQLHCCLYAFLYMYHMLNDKVMTMTMDVVMMVLIVMVMMNMMMMMMMMMMMALKWFGCKIFCFQF